LLRFSEPSPPSLPCAQTVRDAFGGERALDLRGGRLRIELAAALRAVRVVRDADRRASGGADARAARDAVVLEDPVQGRVGAEDEDHGAGRQGDDLRAGAAPRTVRAPPATLVGRPATMPATCVPWPPAAVVSVSLTGESTKHRFGTTGVINGPQPYLRLRTTAPRAVGLAEEGVRAVDARVDDRDAHAGAGERGAVGELRAGPVRRDVRRRQRVLEALVALEVGHARARPGGADLGGRADRDRDADLLELLDEREARVADGRAGGRRVRAVHRDGDGLRLPARCSWSARKGWTRASADAAAP
jgi:hypothetical protein